MKKAPDKQTDRRGFLARFGAIAAGCAAGFRGGPFPGADPTAAPAPVREANYYAPLFRRGKNLAG